MGLNPSVADTDGDGVPDNLDMFPNDNRRTDSIPAKFYAVTDLSSYLPDNVKATFNATQVALDDSHHVAKMKAAVFVRMKHEYARIRRHWQGDSRYDREFAKPWNNARLNTVATYFDLVPGFERLLKAHQGDLRSFYAAVEKIAGMQKPGREAFLRRIKSEKMSFPGQ